MRFYILWAIVLGLIVYAWRDWFVSLCGLILLSVVMQRRDFPSYLLGINGLNPWNLLFLTILLAWLVHRRRSGVPLGLPKDTRVLFGAFCFVVFISYVRCAIDLDSFPDDHRQTFVGFTGDFLVNRIKFVLPALLLFDACRTRRRVRIAMGVILLSGFAYAVLVIKHVPLSSLMSSSQSEFMRYRHRIDRDIGLMAIDMSMLLAGSFWAMVAVTVLAIRRRAVQVLMLGPLAAVFLGMLLCHSRGSYFGFAAAGVVLAAARWRWLLLCLPVAVVVVFAAMPAVPARLGMGLGVSDVSGQTTHDWHTVTAGRMTTLWPAAIEQISKGPVFGFGGEASRRTEVREAWGKDATSHPHNAYLEALLDMGLVGLVPVVALYGGIGVMALRLFRNRSDRLAAAVGGMALSCITVLLVTAMGAQSFYPTQSTIPYWCCWALALRVAIEQRSAARFPGRSSSRLSSPGSRRPPCPIRSPAVAGFRRSPP